MKPSRSGFYWYWENEDKPTIVEVVMAKDDTNLTNPRSRVWYIGGEFEEYLDPTDARFEGPLEAPCEWRDQRPS